MNNIYFTQRLMTWAANLATRRAARAATSGQHVRQRPGAAFPAEMLTHQSITSKHGPPAPLREYYHSSVGSRLVGRLNRQGVRPGEGEEAKREGQGEGGEEGASDLHTLQLASRIRKPATKLQ